MKKLSVYLTPGSRSPKVVMQEDGVVAVHVRSLPKEGAANKELVERLAEHFGVAKSQVIIKSGWKSRNKLVVIQE